jgi:hypothetical protein
MREERGGQLAKREKTPLLLHKPEIMFSSFFLISCSTNMQD